MYIDFNSFARDSNLLGQILIIVKYNFMRRAKDFVHFVYKY